MTASPFSVVSITLLPTPKPTGNWTVLAYITVEIGGAIVVPGIALLRGGDGSMSVGLPRTVHGDRLTFSGRGSAQELLRLVGEACRQIRRSAPEETAAVE